MKRVEIYVANNPDADPVLAGIIKLIDGKLDMQIRPGFDVLMENIMKESIFVNNKSVTPEDDPEAFFAGLPLQYRGSYMWAELKDD